MESASATHGRLQGRYPLLDGERDRERRILPFHREEAGRAAAARQRDVTARPEPPSADLEVHARQVLRLVVHRAPLGPVCL